MNKEEKIKYLLGGFGLVSLIVVILLIVLSETPNSTNQESNSSVSSYSREDLNRPRLVLSTTKIDWGEIKLSNTKESEVVLKNEGESPLEITRMSTSCGCTAIKVILPDGKETKEYSMHKTSEKVTVAPNTQVKLKIIYRPFTMPVEGVVTRQIFLETNDPINKKLTIDVSAVVRK